MCGALSRGLRLDGSVLLYEVIRRNLALRRVADPLQVFRRGEALAVPIFMHGLLSADPGQFAELCGGHPLNLQPFIESHTGTVTTMGTHGQHIGCGRSVPDLVTSPAVEGPYNNRLEQCMRAAGINDPELADLAATTKQQIFKLRHGERKLTVEWAKRLAPHLHVAWQEMIEGPVADPAARELLEAYRTTDQQGRDMLLRLARSLRRDTDPPDRPGRAAACVVELPGRKRK